MSKRQRLFSFRWGSFVKKLIIAENRRFRWNFEKESQVFEGSLVCTVTMQSADCILSPVQSADCAGSQIACNISVLDRTLPFRTWTPRYTLLLVLFFSRFAIVGGSSLAISGIGRQDTGDYVCTASNNAGIISATAKVSVLGMLLVGVAFNLLIGCVVKMLQISNILPKR